MLVCEECLTRKKLKADGVLRAIGKCKICGLPRTCVDMNWGIKEEGSE
jgi:hypothetical protein